MQLILSLALCPVKLYLHTPGFKQKKLNSNEERHLLSSQPTLLCGHERVQAANSLRELCVELREETVTVDPHKLDKPSVLGLLVSSAGIVVHH